MKGTVEGRNKISSMQTMLLVVYTVLPTAILFVPGITSGYSKNDGWISTLLAGCFGLTVAILSAALTRKYPEATVVQFSSKIVGKWLGSTVGLLYSLYFLYVAYFVQREFSDFMGTFVLPQTPPIFIISTFTILSAYGLYLGLEVLARTNSLTALVGIFTLVVVIAFMTKDMNLDNLLPILKKNSPGSIVMGALAPGCWISECVIILMFSPYMNKPRQSLKISIYAVVTLVAIMTLFVISGLSIFGHEIVSRLNFPLFNLVKYMRPALFFERADPIFIAIWITGMIMKFSIYYFTGVLALSQVFRLKEYRPLVLPTGLLLVALSIVSWDNVAELKDFSRNVFPPSVCLITIGLTFLLAGTVWIRQIFEKNR